MVIDFRVRGHKGAYHPNEQAVAFCDYCRKPICRKCAEKGQGQGMRAYCNAECREADDVRRREKSFRERRMRLKKILILFLEYAALLLLLAATAYFIIHCIHCLSD